MPLEDLMRWLRAQPFVPFRIHLTNGNTFDIRHPEQAMAFARSVVIGTIQDPNLHNFLQMDIVALVHVARLEQLMPSSVSSNGATA